MITSDWIFGLSNSTSYVLSDDWTSGKLEKENVSNLYEMIILCMQKTAVFSI